MLNVIDTTVVVIDVQEKLFRVMHNKERLLDNLTRLLRGLQKLHVQVIFTEQNPAGLGRTISEIRNLYAEFNAIPKMSFSAASEVSFMNRLKKSECGKVLLCGIEAHICVYQTAIELKELGYHVQLLVDCIASRSPENVILAVDRLMSEGIYPTGMEMALFELMRTATHSDFREIQSLIK